MAYHLSFPLLLATSVVLPELSHNPRKCKYRSLSHSSSFFFFIFLCSFPPLAGAIQLTNIEGKEEAAARLEDQLSLIHTKFQELSGKFELFQRPSDYDGRLGRITRQLVDLQSNMYLTELISHEPEAIQVRSRGKHYYKI